MMELPVPVCYWTEWELVRPRKQTIFYKCTEDGFWNFYFYSIQNWKRMDFVDPTGMIPIYFISTETKSLK